MDPYSGRTYTTDEALALDPTVRDRLVMVDGPAESVAELERNVRRGVTAQQRARRRARNRQQKASRRANRR